MRDGNGNGGAGRPWMVMSTPGTVGVISGELSRYAEFSVALAELRLRTAGFAELRWERGPSISDNRNRVVRNMAGDWVCFIDDDHVFQPDLVWRLLVRSLREDLDIVGGLYPARKPPWGPIAFVPDPTAPFGLRQLRCDELPSAGGLVMLPPGSGLGMGATLIRRRVFEAIPAPWFEEQVLPDRYLGEDLTFCQKAGRAGFRVALDCDVAADHLTTVRVRLARNAAGAWGVDLDLDGLVERFELERAGAQA